MYIHTVVTYYGQVLSELTPFLLQDGRDSQCEDLDVHAHVTHSHLLLKNHGNHETGICITAKGCHRFNSMCVRVI